MESDKSNDITQLACELNESGQSTRPLYEAAATIEEQEFRQRRAALEERAAGYLGPLDPRLFPPEVFDTDGERRLSSQGHPMLTRTEVRAAFEWADSRCM